MTSDVKKLKIGTQEHHGRRIEMQPLITRAKGMCFKLNFSNSLEDQEDPLILYVSNLNDEVKKIHIIIAEKNTWQGTKMPTAVEFHGVQMKFNKYSYPNEPRQWIFLVSCKMV